MAVMKKRISKITANNTVTANVSMNPSPNEKRISNTMTRLL